MSILSLLFASVFLFALVHGQMGVKMQTISLEPLELQVSVTNPFSYPVPFLQWGTPFEGIWTDMFDIRDENNNRLDYIGMLVRRGEQPLDEEYLTVPARGTITTIVDLGDNYAFSSVGNYVIRLDLPTYSELIFDSSDEQVVSVMLDSIPVRKPVKQPQGFTNCNSQQISQVNSAINGAISEASRAANCLTAGSCNALAVTWFGTYNANNYNYVTTVFRNVNSRLNNYEFNGYCNPAGCGSNVYGYVYPTDTTFTVYMCGLFWSRPAERVNTIVHEMSHFSSLGGTNDYAYGKAACMNLARSNPAQASRNADNICYFSESA